MQPAARYMHSSTVSRIEIGRKTSALFRAEALTVECPEGDPCHDATLVGGGERKSLRIAQVDIGRPGGDDPLGQLTDGPERHKKRRHVHTVLRQIERREEQALEEKPRSGCCQTNSNQSPQGQ